MIQFVRKYAYVIVLVLMSAFAACLVADEWSDMRHAWQDLQIEATAEIEVEDFEWDEFGGDNGICRTTLPIFESLDCQLSTINCQLSTPFISDKQRLGLVRRYALRKAILHHNYART